MNKNITLDEYLSNPRNIVNYYGNSVNRKRITCGDGFSFSCQASECHYCVPRESFPGFDTTGYTRFELGFPSDEEPLIMDYAEDDSIPTETVYGYVPRKLVESLIAKHGGIK